jgi:hypothetical protein
MKSVNLSELTDQELMEEAKKRKNSQKTFRFLIGLMVGAAIFSTITKGFSTSTCLPVFFVPIFLSIEKNYKDVQAEIQSRNLNN